MVRVIGVRFRTAGKIYFFDPLQFDIKRGDHVIVETARGIEFGTVVSGAKEVEDGSIVQPLKPVLRIANARDMEQEASNKEKEKEAFRICQEKIRKHELDMKLIDAEYTFDNNKVLFYFTADGRIDFRELVKDLAGVFKTRIELRQIGVRDETKIRGGIGICGRPLCCHSYLADFVPVSIKMAKEQNLSLNPTKISGVCGRLMCCLKNEEETYEELNRRLPNVGDFVTTDDGLKGVVNSVNVLRQLVKVVVEEGDTKEIHEYEVDRLHFRRRHSKKERKELTPEELAEMQELERLEKEDREAKAEAKAQAAAEKAEREKAKREAKEPAQDKQGNRGKGSGRSERSEGEREDSGRRSERGGHSRSRRSEEERENGNAQEGQNQSNRTNQGGRNGRRRDRQAHRGEQQEGQERRQQGQEGQGRRQQGQESHQDNAGNGAKKDRRDRRRGHRDRKPGAEENHENRTEN